MFLFFIVTEELYFYGGPAQMLYLMGTKLIVFMLHVFMVRLSIINFLSQALPIQIHNFHSLASDKDTQGFNVPAN